MRHPIENEPMAFFSERGYTSTEVSLRQIMAEEMAQEMKKERSTIRAKNKSPPSSYQNSPNQNQTATFNLNNFHNYNGFSSTNHNNINNLNRRPTEKNYANLIKLDILTRKYQHIVDKNAIEEIFRQKE